jgi:hypothetical protein
VNLRESFFQITIRALVRYQPEITSPFEIRTLDLSDIIPGDYIQNLDITSCGQKQYKVPSEVCVESSHVRVLWAVIFQRQGFFHYARHRVVAANSPSAILRIDAQIFTIPSFLLNVNKYIFFYTFGELSVMIADCRNEFSSPVALL